MDSLITKHQLAYTSYHRNSRLYKIKKFDICLIVLFYRLRHYLNYISKIFHIHEKMCFCIISFKNTFSYL